MTELQISFDPAVPGSDRTVYMLPGWVAERYSEINRRNRTPIVPTLQKLVDTYLLADWMAQRA